VTWGSRRFSVCRLFSPRSPSLGNTEAAVCKHTLCTCGAHGGDKP
jgi:hypothetical protein